MLQALAERLSDGLRELLQRREGPRIFQRPCPPGQLDQQLRHRNPCLRKVLQSEALFETLGNLSELHITTNRHGLQLQQLASKLVDLILPARRGAIPNK